MVAKCCLNKKKWALTLSLKNKKSFSNTTEAFNVGLQGLEPWISVPKTGVLPLHHRPMPFSGCKFNAKFQFYKLFLANFVFNKLLWGIPYLEKYAEPIFIQYYY